jgi:hypothetical protein
MGCNFLSKARTIEPQLEEKMILPSMKIVVKQHANFTTLHFFWLKHWNFIEQAIP